MTPVDLHLLTRLGLEADIRLSFLLRATHLAQQIPHNGNPTVKAFLMQLLQDYGGFDFWILIQPLVNQVKVWIQF